MEMLSHSVNHFYRFFLLLKIFKFYFVFTGAFSVVWCLTFRKKSEIASSFFGNRMLRKLNAQMKRISKYWQFHSKYRCAHSTNTHRHLRDLQHERTTLLHTAYSNINKAKISFSTCYKHGRSDFLIWMWCAKAEKRICFSFVLLFGCYLYKHVALLRWFHQI